VDDPGERSPSASEDPLSTNRGPSAGPPAVVAVPQDGLPALRARQPLSSPPRPPSSSLLVAEHEEPDSSVPSRRGRRAHFDLSTGSVPKHLWRLTWPQWLENVLGVIDQLIDLFWAGRLPAGYHAIAGVGVTQTFVQFGNMARQGFDQALRAMISRAVGARDIPLANHIALQAFTLSTIYCIIVVTAGWVLTDVLLSAVGVSDEVRAETAFYMRVMFLGVAPMAYRNITGATLQASGDVITPLKATTVTRVLGIVLTPVLMFGWLGFPSYGLTGAAIANIIAQTAGASVNFYALFRGNSLMHLTFRGYRVDFVVLGRLLRLGVPASLGGMERAISQLVLLGIITPFGDVAVVAYSLTRRVETIANFGGMGVGNAAGVMVGQNLGAGRPDRSRQSVGYGLVYVFAISMTASIPLLVAPALFVSLFTPQPEVIELTAVWLRILVFAAIFLGFGQVFQQAFNTAGDTITVAIVTFLSLIAIELPLAWFLSHGLGIGPLGMGWAHLVGMALRVAFFIPVFFWGRWLRIKVL